VVNDSKRLLGQSRSLLLAIRCELSSKRYEEDKLAVTSSSHLTFLGPTTHHNVDRIRLHIGGKWAAARPTTPRFWNARAASFHHASRQYCSPRSSAELARLHIPRDPSQRPSNAQVPASESALPPHRIPVSGFEYQWGNELVGQLFEATPTVELWWKFAIIADPSIDNAMRAQMFADQLRSQGVPISCVAALPSVGGASLSYSSESSHFLRTGEHTLHRAHTLVFPCKCKGECPGRFLVSVGDDTTHPYGVPGQRIGVALYQPSSG
jgi:hypothetical protein